MMKKWDSTWRHRNVLMIELSMLLVLIVAFVISCLQPNYSAIKIMMLVLIGLACILLVITIFSRYCCQKVAQARIQELYAKLAAISESQAIMELNMDGTVLHANEKFLQLVGYSLHEIVGKHHTMFVDAQYSQSEAYSNFWAKLRRGEYVQAECKRLGKNNKVIWLLSSYNPIITLQGKPIKVIKVATDISQEKAQRNNLEKLTNTLKEINVKIVQESNEISVGVCQLESALVEQVTSATEQATAVTEISATIAEMKATTNQTKEKARQLGESAALTKKKGTKGKLAVASMAESIAILQDKMQQISTTILSLNDKTQQISEIIEAVADIAKQSKMLALNASIEAAKAGESGKGFAVVASEVKDLAERSQQSTERVQKILQDIRQTAEHAVMVTEEGARSVEKNAQQVKFTGEVIHSLENVIEEASLASLQIVSVIREEYVAMEQIDISIREINKITHLFSESTEQTSKATIGLSKIAESLKNTVNQYNVYE